MAWFLRAAGDGFRAVRHNLGFAVAASLMIAVAVGPATAILTIVDGVLLRPLAYADADRLVRLLERTDAAAPSGIRRRAADGLMELSEVAALRVRTRTLSHIGLYQVSTTTLTANADTASLETTRVSAAIFEMLGVRPLVGRVIEPADEKGGGEAVVVLSHGLWQRRFGARRDAVGEIVSIDGRDYQIVGVMPAGFQFPPESPAQMWIPFVPPMNEYRNYRPVIAKVATGRTLTEVEKEIGALVTRYRRSLNGAASSAAVISGPAPPPPPPPLRPPSASPAPPPPRQAAPPPLPLSDAEFSVVAVHDQLVAPIRRALEMLAWGAVLLLVVASANFAGLTLARAWARQQEFAVRAALGAPPRSVAIQLFTENLILGLVGAGIGAMIAAAGVQALRVFGAIASRQDLGLAAGIPRSADLYLDLRGTIFTVTAAVVVSTASGFLPAWRSAARETIQRLRAQMASAPSGLQLKSGRQGLEGALVVLQVAMSVTLLIGAALFTRSLLELATTEPGYDTQNVLTFQVRPARLQSGQSPLLDQRSAGRLLTEYNRMIARIQTLPGVAAAGYSQALPMTRTLSVIILRMTPDPPRNRQLTPPDFSGPLSPETPNVRAVSSGFLEALGARVLAGRSLSAGDHENAPRVMLMNRTLAESGFIWQQPIGRQIYAVDRQPWEIVGVVEDIRRFGLDQTPDPQIYVDLRQAPELLLGGAAVTFAVRAHDDAAALSPLILKSLRQLDPDVTMDGVVTTAQLLSASLSRSRLYATLLNVLAAVAITLAALGVYAMLTYTVTRRTREIGIHVVLGAQTADVCRLILGQALTLVIIGGGVGLVGGFLATRALTAMLYGVSSADPLTYVLVSTLLLAVAISAAVVPLRRALRVEPAVTLRAE